MNTNNPFVLVSLINTKLRDFYQSFDQLCEMENLEKKEIIDKLAEINFYYDESINQFK